MHEIITAFADAIRHGNDTATIAAAVVLLGILAIIGATLFTIAETVFDTVAKWAPGTRLEEKIRDLDRDLHAEEEAHDRSRADHDSVVADREQLRELLSKIYGADLVAGVIHSDLRAHVDTVLGMPSREPKAAYCADLGGTAAADPDAVSAVSDGEQSEADAAARRAQVTVLADRQPPPAPDNV